MHANIVLGKFMTFDFETCTLIVGGGPSGSTLARKLSKNNITNILIEKNDNYDKPCGGGIKSIVYEEFDIPKEIEFRRITKFDLFSPNKKVSVDLTRTPISIVLRKDFDKLNRKLAQKAGTELLFSRFLKFERKDEFVYSYIKIDNETKIIKSLYLVGADGVTSTVRKQLTQPTQEKILTIYSNIPNKDIDKCEFYFGEKFAPNEYAWVFPHGDKLSVGSVYKEGIDTETLFKNFKNKVAPNDNTKGKGFYIPTWNKNSLLYEDKVFLLGDAAGQVLPFSYEGIYYVMKSALVLADAIIENKPENYEINWNKKYKKRFKFFKTMQKIFLSSTFMTDKMIAFFQNEKLQQRGLQYWEGTAQPLSFIQTVLKITKHLIKN
ncbi:geranylgeranyl reductase [Arcobacter nitrofigilis DSM 7299]|uniref:Geranylgeranyl reductase n=1 Tax=Arcobacter nitrofigilis (strain ATCC 33309 / DSM 7299 / CCUG 15893 / LMG 7604 / NCTC 12251 / CI) TaxID=572480 RepID=D5V313_ARCNC|nr:NAD(P)/FAD-dependent oxidoreductase [Arcobacter nitrofigilis]ADG92595.1 geranylgeranyl reductase [Arcobacter nitrofigilis DSM 7299]